MVVGLGVDILDVDRMAAELRTGDAGLAGSVFTPAEIAACEAHRHPARRYAMCFAAKEAALKALSPDGGPGVGWVDIEVSPGAGTAPALSFRGAAAAMAARRGVTDIWLSLAVTQRLALASVILESHP
jgi:holo-[acyl-carrier protein] synthase